MEEVEQLAKKKSRIEEIDQRSTSTDPLLSCCMCRRLLHDAVQLKCLHNCCRQCFSSAASAVDSHGVSCVTCGAITQAGSEQPNGFIDAQVRRYRAIAESRACGMCKGNAEHDKPALMWCATCRQSLCGDCIAGHIQCSSQHVTQPLEGPSYQDEVCSRPSASACVIHKKPLDIACRNCEQAKCISCWAECNEKKHTVHVVGKESFDIYVVNLISSILSLESELLEKSEVLEKARSYPQKTKAVRDRHLEEISMRKRRVMDAVQAIYQEIATATRNTYDELVAERDAAAAVADRIDAHLSDALNYIRRLVESDDKCEILIQQKIVRERLTALSVELDSLSDRLAATMREVKIEVSLPDDLEDVVRAWIGMPRVYAASSSRAPPQLQQQQQHASSSLRSQQQQQSFFLGAASASVTLPIKCVDAAVTQDGRSLLLAALHHGLIELSSSGGRELSRWPPPKHGGTGWNEQVLAVAALGDGRAAVSLHGAELVVLLRRNEKSSGTKRRNKKSSTGGAAAAGGDAWTEYRRLQLTWRPHWLSAHGDVLAACEWSESSYYPDPCQWGRLGGQRLQLLSLSSGRLLSDADLQREYIIGSLAVAARVVVTGSYCKVNLGDGRRAEHVLDAHSLLAYSGSDKRLWRHVLSSSSDSKQEGEELLGVCADSIGGCLYAAVCKSDMTSGRVSALSLADGSELRRVVLSFHWPPVATLTRLLLPRRLSLCDDRAAEQQGNSSRSGGRVLLLAALCCDSTTRECETVTLHRSVNDI